MPNRKKKNKGRRLSRSPIRDRLAIKQKKQNIKPNNKEILMKRMVLSSDSERSVVMPVFNKC